MSEKFAQSRGLERGSLHFCAQEGGVQGKAKTAIMPVKGVFCPREISDKS